MKNLKDIIIEKLQLSRNKKYMLFPKNREELETFINHEISQFGYNCSLNHIDVSNVDDLTYLFYGGEANSDYGYNFGKFDGDISKWDVSKVTDMSGMFSQSQFNGDISNWDVSSVENVFDMFYMSKFDGNLDNWKLPHNCTNISYMFTKCPLQKNPPIWFKK
jgi:hypothetical protein